jgi:hypothetical protein
MEGTRFFFPEFFLEEEMLRAKVVEKIKAHIDVELFFPRKSCRF